MHWQAPEQQEGAGVIDYSLWTLGEHEWQLIADKVIGTKFTVTSGSVPLAEGQEYVFGVRARNAVGLSEMSDSVRITVFEKAEVVEKVQPQKIILPASEAEAPEETESEQIVLEEVVQDLTEPQEETQPEEEAQVRVEAPT